ncbi:MAG: alpha/beta hydrolase-fold protein [Microthrixaceae bacterium]
MQSEDEVVPVGGLDRRRFLRGVGGVGALGLLAGAVAGCAPAPGGGGSGGGSALQVVDHGVFGGRMHYYRFATNAISTQPAVNVLLPDDYDQNPSRRYPVMYLLHGGVQDFRTFDLDHDIRGLTAGRRIIIVMPDGGTAGWYSNPVTSFAGPRNWETFHIQQLIPWIDANFRTYAEAEGRAVSGFSMGGFGALKYAAKYYGHFASVGSHSGPASLRRDLGAVVHWANLSSAAVELAGGTIYGAPLWDEARVSADNPVERVPSFRNKRVMLVCGTASELIDFDFNETEVQAGQREFSGLLNNAGIDHEFHQLPGGHFVRREMLQRDIDGAIARLRKA